MLRSQELMFDYLIPAQSDVFITSLATHSYIPEALEAGVKVFYIKGFQSF